MNWHRKLLILSVALALTVGTSCTGELPLETQIEGDAPSADGGSVSPADGETVPPEDTSAVPPGDGSTVPPEDGETLPPLDSDLLLCEPQPYATATAVIGPKGGQINVGGHSLKIPENALSEDVTITAEQIEGRVNSVQFSPEGLTFAIPAVLTLDYQNCANVGDPKRVVFTDESLNVLQSLPSLDFNGTGQVETLIDYLSRYAVAY